MPGSESQREHQYGGYVVRSSEYVSDTELPPNDLFEDPEKLERMMTYALDSIEQRRQTPQVP